MSTSLLAGIKYHFKCLTLYRNKYSQFQLPRHNNTGTIHYQQSKAMAYSEIFIFIGSQLRDGITEFSRSDLKTKCEEILKGRGYDVILNKELFEFWY